MSSFTEAVMKQTKRHGQAILERTITCSTRMAIYLMMGFRGLEPHRYSPQLAGTQSASSSCLLYCTYVAVQAGMANGIQGRPLRLRLQSQGLDFIPTLSAVPPVCVSVCSFKACKTASLTASWMSRCWPTFVSLEVMTSTTECLFKPLAAASALLSS